MPEYLAQLLRAVSPILFSTIEESGHGTRCLRLDLWREILVGVPPRDEQPTIVKYIDRRSSQIDALICRKQRQIELLQEKRQALISQAVTKGLDPDVSLNESGIEWLGEIPSHWSMKRIKHVVRPFEGIQMGPFGGMLKEIEPEPTHFKLYGQENTINNDFSVGSRWLREEIFNSLKDYELIQGDVVLTRKGASIGNCRVVPDRIQRGVIDSDTIRLRFDENQIITEYAVIVTHEGYLETEILLMQKGAVLPGLNTTTIANLRIALPPMQEQLKIIQFVRP
jgi:type I restriction enzyme S subunit